MNRIICDICGCEYAETAEICPVCGYPRPGTEKAAVAAAETVYASESVSVSWYFESPTVVAITAGGTDQIAFIEFGAGVYADPDHALADESKLGFQVYPGSWSESPEGVGTYPEWVRNGRQGEYKYNRVPRPGLLAAYNAIIREFTSIAHKVFEA